MRLESPDSRNILEGESHDGDTYERTSTNPLLEERDVPRGNNNPILCSTGKNEAIHDVAGNIPAHRKSYAEIVGRQDNL